MIFTVRKCKRKFIFLIIIFFILIVFYYIGRSTEISIDEKYERFPKVSHKQIDLEDYFLAGQKIVEDFKLKNSLLPNLQEINEIGIPFTNDVYAFEKVPINELKSPLKKRIKIKRNKYVDLSLKGGSPRCEVLEPNKVSTSTEYICIYLKIVERPTICLLPLSQDTFISNKIALDGLWEENTIYIIKRILSTHKTMGLFDIGAHIGEFSLVAASMGHKVVAVEPNSISANCLAKNVLVNHFQDLITIVKNAVSDERGTFELETPIDNMGGTALSSQDADPFCDEPGCSPHVKTIYLDDLLEVTNFELAIIKIDVEGHEHRAFQHVDRLFHFVNVAYIIMEWKIMRSYYGTEMDDNERKQSVFSLIDTLIEYGFTPFGLSDFLDLHRDFWYGWNEDIIWVKKGFKLPKT